MKKITILFILFSFLINVVVAQEKSFQKGKITISVGAGLGVYNKKTSSELTIGNTVFRKDTAEGASSGVFPLTLEYGVKNWLGLGVRGAYLKYISKADASNNNTKPTVTGLDLGLVCNIHLLKTVRFDLPLSFNFGYSNYKSLSNDAVNTIVKSNGINYSMSLIPRLYFGSGRRFGLYVNLGYSGYNYPKLKLSANGYNNQNTLNDLTGNIKTNGVDFGFGIILKL